MSIIAWGRRRNLNSRNAGFEELKQYKAKIEAYITLLPLLVSQLTFCFSGELVDEFEEEPKGNGSNKGGYTLQAYDVLPSFTRVCDSFHESCLFRSLMKKKQW